MAVSTLSKRNAVQRRLARPADPEFVRLEMDRVILERVAGDAAACGVSLASYCRLALEMLSAPGKRVTVEDVRKEAAARLAKERAQRKGQK